MKLHLVPITRPEAQEFIRRHHRHNNPPVSAIFQVAISDGEKIRGVAMCGRPMSRHLCDDFTLEIVRVCTDGVKNGCSMLYGACIRAAKALGYRRIITYTLEAEPGGSLRATGLKVNEEWRVKNETWHSPSRPRVDKHPMQQRLRWEMEVT